MSGIELATAYVSVVAETRGIDQQLRKAFQNTGKSTIITPTVNARGMEQAGTNASARLHSAFQSDASRRGEKVGKAVGTVIGKGVGLGITAGIGVAATGVAAAVGGIGFSLSKGFSRLKKIDDAKFKLSALGNSAADVESIMKSAESSVKGTAFALDESANAAASAVAAGVKPGDELTNYLKNIADTAAIANTSFDEMASIFNKVQANGKAYTDDLQQLQDRGVPVMQYLRQQYGVTADEFDDMVKDGKVSSADFAQALQGNLGGAAQKMGESFSGSVANAEAALGRIGAALLKPAFGQAAGGVGSITGALDGLGKWLSNNQDKIIDFWKMLGNAAITGMQQAILAVSDISEAIADLIAPIGDVLGAVNKFQAWQADIRGDGETADALREEAEGFFSWGEDLHSVSDRLQTTAENMDSWRDTLDKWGDKAKKAAELTKAFGDAIVSVDGEQIIISDNSPKINENLDALGIRLENLPDGRVTLVPNTPEAQQQIDAFLGKNNPTPPMVAPLDADTRPAQAKLNAFLEQWKTSMTSLPAPGNSGGNPLTDPLGINGGTPTNPLTAPLVGTGTQGGMGGPGPLPNRAGGGQSLGATTSGKQFFGSAADTSGLHPNAAALKSRYQGMGFSNIGGYSANVDQPWDEHQTGTAIDVMVSDPAKGNSVLKDALAQPGTKYAIWQQKTWYPDGRVVKMEDRGSPTENHMDHVHIRTYATGGGVNGPGGVDNVPAWLSRGEHVLTTDDVKAMGGQAGVYAFRNMLAGGASPLGLVQTDTDPKPGKKGPQYGGTPDRKPGNNPNQIAIPDWSKPGTGWGDPPEDWWLKPINPDDVLFPEFWGQNPWGPHPLEKGRFGFLNNMLADGGEVQLFDKGGRWKSGTLGMNKTGKDEFVLTPERLAELEKRDAQKGNTPHGAAQGAPPGPSPEELEKLEQPELNEAGRQEGYIPSGAGYSGATGGGLAGSLIGMGAEAVNGLIDQAAGAASMGADVFAPGSSVAIQMGAAIAKRGVQYAAEMGSIGIGALSEILLPFGAPRWLSDVDATSFMPQQAMTAATTTTSEQAVEDIQNQHGQQQGAAPGPIPPQGPQPPGGLDMLSKATQESADALAPPPLPPLVNVEKIEAADSGAVGESIAKGQRLAMMRFAGRP